MCDCLKVVSDKLEAKLKEDIGPIEKNVYSFDHVGFDNQSLMFSISGNGFSGYAIGLPFSVQYYRKKKDGSRASTRTKKDIKVFMTYCPFCGQKYPTDEK